FGQRPVTASWRRLRNPHHFQGKNCMNPTPDIEAASVATHGPGVAANDEAAYLTEGLTGTVKSELNNPVLPSDFDLLVPSRAAKRNWEFANRNPVPFRKAWKGFQTLHPIKAL